MSDKILTIQEAANLLKVHYQTVRNYIERGDLPASKVGRNIRLKLTDVQNMLSNNTHDAEPMREMEIRFLTSRREEIEQRLLKQKAKVSYHGHVIDHWFVPNSIKNMQQKDEWFDTAKGFGLRIREQDNGYTGKITTTLEVKRLVTPYHHEHCIEHEIDVPSYEDVSTLLNLMEFKEFMTIDKDRLVYAFNGFKIVIDDIKDFATGVEIERMTSRGREEVLQELLQCAAELGLDVKKELVEKSVTYLAMQQMAKY